MQIQIHNTGFFFNLKVSQWLYSFTADLLYIYKFSMVNPDTNLLICIRPNILNPESGYATIFAQIFPTNFLLLIACDRPACN